MNIFLKFKPVFLLISGILFLSLASCDDPPDQKQKAPVQQIQGDDDHAHEEEETGSHDKKGHDHEDHGDTESHEDHDEENSHKEEEAQDDHGDEGKGHDHGDNESHEDHDENNVHTEESSHKDHGHEEQGDHEKEDGHAGHGGHGGNDDHEEEQVVSLTKEGLKEFGIETATVTRGNIKNFVQASGEVVVNQDRTAHVTPRVSGVVRKVMKTLGDHVKKGEILAILDSSELADALSDYDLAITAQKIADSGKEIALLNTNRQQKLHDNTLLLLQRLNDQIPLNEITKEFKNKVVGENRARLFKSYSAMALTKASYTREKGLWEKKISSESDYLQSKSAFESSRSEYTSTYEEVKYQNTLMLSEKKQALQQAEQAVQASKQKFRASAARLRSLGFSNKALNRLKKTISKNTDLGRYELRAPISGKVIAKHLTLGERVGNEAKTFVLANFQTLWVDLTIYQKDLSMVRAGQSVEISSRTGSVDPVHTKIAYISPLIDEKTRAATARVILENPERKWRPGLFINGKIAVYDHRAPLMIPKSALQTVEGKTVVFIETKKGFKASPVTIGNSNQTHVEILSGLKPWQRYVSKGIFTLKAQLAKGSFGDGHNH